MTIKVSMWPHVDDLQPQPTAGISRVVKNYFKYLPAFDIEMLPKGATDADIIAIHAGALADLPQHIPVVSHCHGLYFTADSNMPLWCHEVNSTVIDIIRHASAITVPSNWVAETFRRDMHLSPAVIPHGIEWDEWQQGSEDTGYILWNKNRSSDACNPEPVNLLAARAPSMRFLTTYAGPNPRPNIKITGTVPFDMMRDMILKSSIYLATTKETFGIGTLEAMAAGKPILGFDHGGNADLVQHGFSGYLAAPDDYDDLAQGLNYCLSHARTLGRNAREVAKTYTWERAAAMVAEQYALTVSLASDKYSVAVVIPCYNKADTILRAVRSAINQTRKPNVIYVVNNNSTDDLAPQLEIARKESLEAGISFDITNCEAQGVAHARNYGIRHSGETLICCLDADDEILPEFIERCRTELMGDRSLGIAYTAMEVVDQTGITGVSQWPSEYNFNQTLKGRNQVPTCCLFLRDAWERAGGYRQRYAPEGAGSEDADLWLRIGLLGYGGKRATAQPLFRYYLGGAVSGNPNYREKDWRGDKGWLNKNELPFAATTTPANGLAHPVRQYDDPTVTVIIPVGPGHVWTLWDALDSVEGQTFRQWEVKVIKDDQDAVIAREIAEWQRLKKAFPFARFHQTSDGPRGAGYTRNVGADLAKAPLLLFLDADDWLVPTALDEMVTAYNQNPDTIIYTDYIGYAYISDNTEGKMLLEKLHQANRLIGFNEKTGEAKIRYHAFPYDCQRAQSQPQRGREPYIWNVVSSLVPKEYHKAIGGFDEKMDSWEDWDYWVRIAKAGHCFTHLDKPLLEYRFYTGKRRSLANPGESGENGRQLSNHLLEYMQGKYEEIENMPCKGCGGSRSSVIPPMPANTTLHNFSEGGGSMSADDMITVELIDGNVGDHLVAFQGVSYGYRVHGDRFSMKRAHAQIDRRVRIIDDATASVALKKQPVAMPPPPLPRDDEEDDNSSGGMGFSSSEIITDNTKQEPVKEPDIATPAPPVYDFTQLWGLSDERADLLKSRGIRTLDGLIMYGHGQVAKLFDMPDNTARRIISEAKKAKEK